MITHCRQKPAAFLFLFLGIVRLPLRRFEWARAEYASKPNEVFTVSAYGDLGHATAAAIGNDEEGRGSGSAAFATPIAETGKLDGTRDGSSVASSRGAVLDSSEYYTCARRRHFTPWGWGTWRDRFEAMASTYTGWDAQMNFELRHPERGGPDFDRLGFGLRGSRFEVFPLLSRANNIGIEGGIHARWVGPDEMARRQFLYANTAWDLLSSADEDNNGVSTTDTNPVELRLTAAPAVAKRGAQPGARRFSEIHGSDAAASLCARCRDLRCGPDTVRGLGCLKGHSEAAEGGFAAAADATAAGAAAGGASAAGTAAEEARPEL